MKEPPVVQLTSKVEQMMDCLGAGMCGKFVGPMPAVTFLDAFLTKTGDGCPSYEGAFNFMSHGLQEAEIDSNLVSIAQAWVARVLIEARRFAPHLRFVTTWGTPDPAYQRVSFPIGPHAAAYSKAAPKDVVTDFSQMEFYIQFMPHVEEDPFCDPPKNSDGARTTFTFEHDSETAKHVRARLTTYAVACMDRQFRNLVFSIGIFGLTARFIRWDRAGAVVSEAFDYTQNPQFLAEFFWRYNHLDACGRGWDPSVSSPNDVIAEKARSKLGLAPAAPVTRFMVPDADGSQSYYVGHKPISSPRSLVGRATRSFSVFEEGTERVKYLKDSWRILGDDMLKESEVYKTLQKHEVPHIVRFLTGDDVLDHRTVTADYKFESWAWKTSQLLNYRHHRMIFDVAGHDLCEFRSTRDLVQAIRDAVEGESTVPACHMMAC